MGQEYGQVHEWAENKALDWEDLEKPAHRQMQNYTKALTQLYKTHPALWKLDYDSDGFEWINCVEWEKSTGDFPSKVPKTGRHTCCYLVISRMLLMRRNW